MIQVYTAPPDVAAVNKPALNLAWSPRPRMPREKIRGKMGPSKKNNRRAGMGVEFALVEVGLEEKEVVSEAEMIQPMKDIKRRIRGLMMSERKANNKRLNAKMAWARRV